MHGKTSNKPSNHQRNPPVKVNGSRPESAQTLRQVDRRSEQEMQRELDEYLKEA